MIGLGDQSLGLGDHQLLGRKGTCWYQSLTDGLDQGAEQGLAASNGSAPGSLQPPLGSLVLPTWPRDFGGLGSVSHLLTHCFVWALDQRVPTAAAYPAAWPPPAPAAGLPVPTLPPGVPAPGPLSAPAAPSSRGRFFSTVPFWLSVHALAS